MKNNDIYTKTNQQHLREILGTREATSFSLNEVLLCFKLSMRFFIYAFSRTDKPVP